MTLRSGVSLARFKLWRKWSAEGAENTFNLVTINDEGIYFKNLNTKRF